MTCPTGRIPKAAPISTTRREQTGDERFSHGFSSKCETKNRLTNTAVNSKVVAIEMSACAAPAVVVASIETTLDEQHRWLAKFDRKRISESMHRELVVVFSVHDDEIYVVLTDQFLVDRHMMTPKHL